MKSLAIILLFCLGLSACAISKPCTEGGDISWSPPITGDKRCEQKKMSDGKVVNDGKFYQYHQSNEKVALEGQFQGGQKQGIWSFYGQDGQLKVIKYFEKGVEKTPPPEIQKKIDLMIEQKR